MKPKFHQFDCREQNRTDLRQARAVLKYKPDIIIFELAGKRGSPETIFNKYDCENKPFGEIAIIQKSLKKASRKFGYALSNIKTWGNIKQLCEMTIMSCFIMLMDRKICAQNFLKSGSICIHAQPKIGYGGYGFIFEKELWPTIFS